MVNEDVEENVIVEYLVQAMNRDHDSKDEWADERWADCSASTRHWRQSHGKDMKLMLTLTMSQMKIWKIAPTIVTNIRKLSRSKSRPATPRRTRHRMALRNHKASEHAHELYDDLLPTMTRSSLDIRQMIGCSCRRLRRSS